MSLHVQETYIDRDKGAQFGESDVYDTGVDSTGELYRRLQREYGRCVSKVYVDREGQAPRVVGWVFVSRQKYEDDPTKTYLREVWVTVHKDKPTRTTQYHYAELGEA